MTTGEGGMVITKNKNLAERIKLMQSWNKQNAFDRFSPQNQNGFMKL